MSFLSYNQLDTDQILPYSQENRVELFFSDLDWPIFLICFVFVL